MSEHTKEPWSYERNDWRGQPSEHKMYISGNEYECYEDGDESDNEPTRVATAICIVEGNATSTGVTEANARRIVACVNYCRNIRTPDLELFQPPVMVNGRLFVPEPNEKRCPECGYTAKDQEEFGDHHLCNGVIPS